MQKPLATLCVLFYNQDSFVEATIKGALSQTYDNLEIILSDDCSTDGTYAKIKDVVSKYKGPHRVIVNRNNNNMGLVPHMNKVLYQLSHGDYIFINGGDDISMPDRVTVGISYFLQYPEVNAVTFSRVIIDKFGTEKESSVIKEDYLQDLSDPFFLQSPSFMSKGVALSLRKSVISRFGPMADNCQTEDSVLRFRALLLGKTLCSAQIGLKYRVHDKNISRHIYRLKTEQIAQQYRIDLEKVKEHLSPVLYEVLSMKIDFYIKYRNLQAEASNASFFKRQYIKIKEYRLASIYKESISEMLLKQYYELKSFSK